MPGAMAAPKSAGKRKRKQGVRPTVPLLPADTEDVDVSEEDIEFVEKHKNYAGFLANLDTKKITRQVLGLKPDQDEDLETFYEKRAERIVSRESESAGQLSVDLVDVLPVKSLDGQLHYRTRDVEALGSGDKYVSVDDRRAFVQKSRGQGAQPGAEGDGVPSEGQGDISMEVEKGFWKDEKKLTKAERRKAQKLSKKQEKVSKKQEKDEGSVQQQPTISMPSMDERPDEVGTYISVQEKRAQMKDRMAEISTALLADPEANISSLKELQDICLDRDDSIAQLAMLSAMAVFRDLVPGYRIRLPTQKELEMPVSKEVRLLRDFESALLRSYKAYVQLLVRAAKSRIRRKTALRCICGLLDAAPHFNYRDSLLAAIIPRMNSEDIECRSMSCEAVRMLFKNEAKHGGHATVEAMQLIADFVKLHRCQAHPDVMKVFLALSFDEDLRKSSTEDDRYPTKKSHKQQLKESKRKKQQLAAQLRKEVVSDFKEAMAKPDPAERKKLQTMTLSAVFETCFRVLKTSLEPSVSRSKTHPESNGDSKLAALGPRPLLPPCLDGLAKFSHLINVDFMGDLLAVLRKLSSGHVVSVDPIENESKLTLTLSERLQCCIIAFKIVRSNMDALNIDLREFYVDLFNLLYELRHDDDSDAEVLAQALEVMLWEGRQHDMQRAAAFIKRLATVSLHGDLAESMAALVTARHLLHRNRKCRNILENDGGGGAVGGTVALFQQDATDPDLSGALSSVLWEAALLRQHYHPSVAEVATELCSLSSSSQNGLFPTMSPTDAVQAYKTSTGGFRPAIQPPPKVVRRKVYKSVPHFLTDEINSALSTPNALDLAPEEAERKFTSYFRVLRDHEDNVRARQELATVTRSVRLWKEFKASRQAKSRKKRIKTQA